MLEIKKVSKYFGGVRAVDDCSFLVRKNTITALIGPNGAGKSTVFNLVSAIEKSNRGKIIFNNKDITKSAIEQISNQGISRLFQQSNLFDNLTVRDNLLLAFDNEDTKFIKNLISKNKTDENKNKKIISFLKKIKMEKYEARLARDLSYGQKRLVELARTIINPHILLMLDEPVAGVTPELRGVIADLIFELKKQGETVLLIEHDMNFTLRVADRVIVMDEGRVIAEGKPEQIKNNKKVIEAYLGE